MAFDCFVQRDDIVLNFNASHRNEPIPRILTVVLQTSVLGAYASEVPFVPDVITPVFMEFRDEVIFFPQQGVDKMKRSVEICRYNPIQI